MSAKKEFKIGDRVVANWGNFSCKGEVVCIHPSVLDNDILSLKLSTKIIPLNRYIVHQHLIEDYARYNIGDEFEIHRDWCRLIHRPKPIPRTEDPFYRNLTPDL